MDWAACSRCNRNMSSIHGVRNASLLCDVSFPCSSELFSSLRIVHKLCSGSLSIDKSQGLRLDTYISHSNRCIYILLAFFPNQTRVSFQLYSYLCSRFVLPSCKSSWFIRCALLRFPFCMIYLYVVNRNFCRISWSQILWAEILLIWGWSHF